LNTVTQRPRQQVFLSTTRRPVAQTTTESLLMTLLHQIESDQGFSNSPDLGPSQEPLVFRRPENPRSRPLEPVQRPQVPTRQEPFQSSPTPRPPSIQFTSEASPFAVQNTTPLPNQRPLSTSPSQRPFSNSPTKRPRGRPNVSSTTR
jgi:hypothetical protein